MFYINVFHLSDHKRLSVEYVSKYLSHGLVETFYRLRVVVDVVKPIPEVHGVVSRCPDVGRAIVVELSQSGILPVRFVNRVPFDMHESRVFPGNDTRHLDGVIVPLI